MHRVIDHTLCRLCLCNGCYLIDIFEEQGGVEFIAKTVIEELLQLEVVKEVLFPWMVCSSCMEKLSEFNLFKRRCIESQHVYDNRVKRGKFSKPRGCRVQDENLPAKTVLKVEPNEVCANGSSTSQDPCSIEESCSSDGNCIQSENFNGTMMTPLEGLSGAAPTGMNKRTSPRASEDRGRRCSGRGRQERGPLTKVGEDLIDIVASTEQLQEPFLESIEETVCVDDSDSVVNQELSVVAPSANLEEEILLSSGEESFVDVSPNRDGPSSSPLFHCYDCGEGFKKKKSLTQHIKVHSAGWMHSCAVCRKVFPQKSTLDMHMILHSEWSKRHFCSKCPKSFVKRKELGQHMLLRHKSAIRSTRRGYHCEVCGKMYRQPGALKKHVLSHSWKSHSCGICSKSFFLKSTLQKHVSTHKQVKALHRCSVCSKSFTQESSFKLHLSLHKELSCGVCHQMFSRESLLKRHMSTHKR